jgi:hypothetical protein
VADRLEEVLELHVRKLRASLELMQTGWLKTSNGGHDTTSESISQTMGWIADLENALGNHRDRRAT